MAVMVDASRILKGAQLWYFWYHTHIQSHSLHWWHWFVLSWCYNGEGNMVGDISFPLTWQYTTTGSSYTNANKYSAITAKFHYLKGALPISHTPYPIPHTYTCKNDCFPAQIINGKGRGVTGEFGNMCCNHTPRHHQFNDPPSLYLLDKVNPTTR